jgi:hypothetical protein
VAKRSKPDLQLEFALEDANEDGCADFHAGVRKALVQRVQVWRARPSPAQGRVGDALPALEADHVLLGQERQDDVAIGDRESTDCAGQQQKQQREAAPAAAPFPRRLRH